MYRKNLVGTWEGATHPGVPLDWFLEGDGIQKDGNSVGYNYILLWLIN